MQKTIADNSNDVLEHLPTKTRRLYTTLIWSYFVISYLGWCNFEGLRFFFIMVLLLAIGSLCYPKQTKLLIFPMSFRRWVMESKVIIACRGPKSVRKSDEKLTWRQQILGALLLSNLFPVILLLSLSKVIYTPVLDLEELDVYEGNIKRIISSRYVRPKLWLKPTEGKTIKFRHIGNSRSAAVKYLKELGHEETIKIWSRRRWGFTPSSSMMFAYQLQHNDFLLIKYEKNVRLKNAKKTKKFVFLLMSYFVISMIYLWLKGNSYIAKKS
jgi:hypothetical protein